MEIHSQRAMNEVGTRAEETSGNQPLLKVQIDFGVKEKAAEIC